jgi:hypothetical protein
MLAYFTVDQHEVITGRCGWVGRRITATERLSRKVGIQIGLNRSIKYSATVYVLPLPLTHYADDALLFHYFPLKLVIRDRKPAPGLHVVVMAGSP